MFSVVVPLYNKESSIESTIQSVLDQTFDDFELIVVDDGSTDNSAYVVDKVVDRRCRVVKKENGGVSSARNAGILAARRDYIVFLDGDDLWSPSHLDALARLIRNFGDSADVFATMIVETKFHDSWDGLNGAVGDRLIDDYFKQASKPIRLLSSSSFAIRRKIVDTVGYFREDLSYGEDVEFWHRIFKLGYKLAVTNQVTAKYRLAAENRSAGRAIPLERRFHIFDSRKATVSEKRYFGKLVLLVISDYARQGDFAIALVVALRYWRSMHWVALYAVLLLLRKAGLAKY